MYDSINVFLREYSGLITSLLILTGGIILFLGIIKYRRTIMIAKSLISVDNNKIFSFYRLHHVLMWFFLTGYLLVFISVIFKISFIGILFTGFIFFGGAVFVFNGVVLQENMLFSIKKRHAILIEKNEQLLQTENVTIFALAYMAEKRDHDTGKHLERTANYVELIANRLSLLPNYKSYMTRSYIGDLVKSAPLHDIGKVGIPDSILLKKGKLTFEEFEMMKKHCEYGVDILRKAENKLDFQSFFSVAVRLVLSHHERWDGKGYPQGLKGDDIPLSARIMALADVYDALRSKRCYKDSMTHSKACEIILKERAKQFDPEIVDVFFKVSDDFFKISEGLAD